MMAALTQCGLIKFFLCPFMRAQPRLLNALVDYWHPDADAFMIAGQSLTPTTEDIYFLTGLSRRGKPVNLHTFPIGERKVSELIVEYCVAGTNRRNFLDTDCECHQPDSADHFVAHRANYWLDRRASSDVHTDELFHSVHGCTDF
jgi:hypothetical protein